MFRTIAILLFVACVVVLFAPAAVSAAKRIRRKHEQLSDKVDPPAQVYTGQVDSNASWDQSTFDLSKGGQSPRRSQQQ